MKHTTRLRNCSHDFCLRARISALARRRRFQELRTLWGAWMRLLVAAAQRWKVEAEETVQAEAELLLVAQRRAILEDGSQAKARLTTEEEAVASIASEWGTLQESVLQRRSELQEDGETGQTSYRKPELAAALRVPDELRAACRRAEEEASTLARSERLALRRDVALQSALREGAIRSQCQVQEREVHRLRRGRQSDLSIQLLSFEDSLDFAFVFHLKPSRCLNPLDFRRTGPMHCIQTYFHTFRDGDGCQTRIISAPGTRLRDQA
eukprot:s5771_g1.t1